MATYLPGVTDYIPQIQPWQPDYNFYQNTLERKQTNYDRGWEQTNSLYNSILNAPMMRTQNVETRDNFFKEIEGQMQQISAVDLSLAQNVNAASQIFKPFYEDDNIMKDIGFTNQYKEAMGQHDYLKTCTDEECKGKAWDGGKRLLQYRAQQFMNASDEEALRLNNPEYVERFDFMGEATKAVAAAGKGAWEIARDEIKGGYKITTVGGNQAIAPLQDFMMATFGEDPRWKSYNKAKATLLRVENPEEAINIYEKQALRSKAKSEEEYKALVEEKNNKLLFNKAKGELQTEARVQKSGLAAMVERKALLEGLIDKNEVLPGSLEDRTYQETNSNIPIKKAAAEKAESTYKIFENMNYVDEEGNKVSNDVIDQIVANSMMQKDVALASQTLAYKNYSQTMEADPFALARFKHRLSTSASKQTANNKDLDANIKRIRELGKMGGRQDIVKAKFLDHMILDQGIPKEYAMAAYIKQFNSSSNEPDYNPYEIHNPKKSLTKVGIDTSLPEAIEEGETQAIELGTAGTSIAVAIPGIGWSVLGGTAIINYIAGDKMKAGMKVHEAITRTVDDMHGDAYRAKVNSIYRSNAVVDNGLKTIFNSAANDNKYADNFLNHLGTYVDGAVKANPNLKEEIGEENWNKYFAGLYRPSSLPGTIGIKNNEALQNIKNDNAYQYITDVIGSDELISMFTSPEIKGNTTFDEKTINFVHGLWGEKEMLAFSQSQMDAKAATLIDDNINNNLNSAQSALIGKGGDDISFTEKLIRESMVTGPDNLKSVSTPQDIYYEAAVRGKKGYHEYKGGDEGWFNTLSENTDGLPASLKTIENDSDYAIKDEFDSSKNTPLYFKEEALKGMLQNSLFPGMDRTGNFNYESLAEGRTKLGGDRVKTNIAWQNVLEDPETKVLRKGDDIVIVNPAFENGYSNAINANDIKIKDGVQNMFNDINNDYPRLVSEFGNIVQNNGVKPSNFNVTSAVYEGGHIIPTEPIQNYNNVVGLWKEALDDIDLDLSQYGPKYQQGDPRLLEVAIQAAEANYSTQDGKANTVPDIEFGYSIVDGHPDITRVDVSFTGLHANKFWKSIDQTSSIKAGDYEISGRKITDVNMPTSGVYYIEKSKNPLIVNNEPNSLYNLIVNNDQPYVDDSMYAKYNSKVSYNLDGPNVKIQILTDVPTENGKPRVDVQTVSEPISNIDFKNLPKAIQRIQVQRYNELLALNQIEGKTVKPEQQK